MTHRIIINSLFALAALGLSPALAAEYEWLANGDFTEGTTPWSAIADSLDQVPNDGHLTTDGAARALGNGAGTTVELRSECIDISNSPALARFHATASIRAADGAEAGQTANIHVFFYRTSDCQDAWGFQQGSVPLSGDGWFRLSVGATPAAEIRSLAVRVTRRDAPEDADTRFDDITMTLRPEVRQFWAIGVGQISDGVLRVSNFNFTRGGAFGSDFNPDDIELERFGNLDITMTGCNTAMVGFEANRVSRAPDFDDAHYPLVRAAANLAAQECERVGFENMESDNSHLSGVWYGGRERDGEGFMIDVLEDGQSAVVSWYTYRPEAVRAPD